MDLILGEAIGVGRLTRNTFILFSPLWLTCAALPVKLTKKSGFLLLLSGPLLLVLFIIGSSFAYSLVFGLDFVQEFKGITFEEIAITILFFPACSGFVWIIWWVLNLFNSRIVSFPGHVRQKYDSLVHQYRIRPLLIYFGVLIVLYSFAVTLLELDQEFGLLESISGSIPTSGTPQDWRLLIAILLLFVGAVCGFGTFAATWIYLKPSNVVALKFGDLVENTLVMLVTLFLMWWYLFAHLAQNLILARPGAFVFLDNTAIIPNVEDFMFYVFASMTNASYVELKPVGLYAHYLVAAMTSSGVLLFVLFVGVALSALGQERTRDEQTTTGTSDSV